MNYYLHHIGDYAQATAHLTFVEDAAYSRLIRKYYAEERPLAAEIPTVQRLIGARTREEKSAVEAVLKEFFFLDADGWHNKRADSEINQYHEKSSKAAASARSRWDKTHTERNTNAMRTHSEGNANHTPVTNNQEPVTINQETIKEKLPKEMRRQAALSIPCDVSPDVWQDFLQARKASKAQVTERVIDSIRKEATSVGWTLDQAMREMVARGWRGFKGDWVGKKQQSTPTAIATAFDTMANYGKPRVQKGDQNVIDITPTARILG